MKVIEVTTVCTASVSERWLLHVTEEEAREAAENPQSVLDLLAMEDVDVLDVKNVDVSNETDRFVDEVRVVSDRG